MSDSWKVPIIEYLRMTQGRSEPEYSLHSFNLSDGMVIFRTKRERKILEDVIAWANDKVIPERDPTSGEPRKKKVKEQSSEGPSIGSVLLQNLHLLTNVRPKTGPWLQALCPSCASIGKDSDENHFYIHEESGGYGCVADCGEGPDLTRALAKILGDAGLSVNDTRQTEKEVTKEQSSNLGRLSIEDEVVSIPGSRLVKNTDHHTVEHTLHDIYDMALRQANLHVYNRVETSKTTGKEDKKEVEVPDDDVRALWTSIIRHIMPSPVLGGTFEVSELWETMDIDRTKQGEKYRRWNFPSDILILLGVLEKDGNTYTVRRAFR
jgi:hypothetical protein